MESQAFKLFLAFIGFMAVGFIIISTTRETPQEKMQGAFLQTSSLLSNLALDKCTEAVKKEAGTHPYTPTQSDSDHSSFVRLIWRNVGTVKEAECRYVMDQGITLLKLDERTLIAKEAVQSTPGSAAKEVHH